MNIAVRSIYEFFGTYPKWINLYASVKPTNDEKILQLKLNKRAILSIKPNEKCNKKRDINKKIKDPWYEKKAMTPGKKTEYCLKDPASRFVPLTFIKFMA